MKRSHGNDHAIVVGASLAGLLAARVLSDHFRQVTIIERDPLTPGVGEHPGVPQAVHAHTLLARGLEGISALFPGLRRELLEGGAIEVDASEVVLHHFGTWKKRFQTGIRCMFQSRPHLEWNIRKRVVAIRNIRLMDRHSVAGLAVNATGRIQGVEVTESGGAATTILADFVLDCSGRGSRTPRLLEAMGWKGPEQSEVIVDVACSTRVYRREGFSGFTAMVVSPTPPRQRRLGFLFPLEGERWICSLGGWSGDHPPTEEAGFMEFARSLPTPHIYNQLAKLQPISGIHRSGYRSSLWRHYENVRLPVGLAVLGDAVCSLNPVYGQGMTTSLLEALELDAHLHERQIQKQPLAENAQLLQKRIAKVAESAWMATVSQDFRYVETVGARPQGIGLTNRYMAQIYRQTAHDEMLALAFYRVMHMLAPPSSLFHPSIMLRVLAGILRPAPEQQTGAPLAGLA